MCVVTCLRDWCGVCGDMSETGAVCVVTCLRDWCGVCGDMSNWCRCVWYHV